MNPRPRHGRDLTLGHSRLDRIDHLFFPPTAGVVVGDGGCGSRLALRFQFGWHQGDILAPVLALPRLSNSFI